MKTKEQIIEKKLDLYLKELSRSTWKTQDLKFISFEILRKNDFAILIEMKIIGLKGQDLVERSFVSPFRLIEIKRGSSFRLNGKVIKSINENIIHSIKQIVSDKLSLYKIERNVRKKKLKNKRI